MAHDRARIARIDDLDRPLHRILPVWRFEALCQTKLLGLVKPSMWVDPREDPCANIVLTPQPGAGFQKQQRQLSDYMRACWAQSWSYEAESDVLLSAYSRVVLDPGTRRNTVPDEEGVRLTTTARKLLAAMGGWADQCPGEYFYLAGVVYEPEEQFGQSLVNRLSRPEGPFYFSGPDGRAESLCTKRSRFRHENEVRLLCVGTDQFGTGENVRQFGFDPSALLTEIAFDPRLTTYEQRERAAKVKELGYAGPIREDSSYIGAFTLVPLPAPWPDPT